MTRAILNDRPFLRGAMALATILLTTLAAGPGTSQCVNFTSLSRVVSRVDDWQPVQQVVVYGNKVYGAKGGWIVATIDEEAGFTNVLKYGSSEPSHRLARGSYFVATTTSEGWIDFRLATVAPFGATFGSVNTPGGSVDVAVDGDHVYVADAPSGLVTANAAGLTGPELTSVVPGPPGGALAVDVGGGIAAVAGTADLWIYDLTIPGLPMVNGQVAVPAGTNDLDLDGDTVYVAGAAGLQVWDVTSPAAPVLLGSHATPAPLLSVRAGSDRVYAPAADGTLLVIDVTVPAVPTTIRSVEVPGIQHVDLYGDLVVAACGDRGLVLLDLGTAASPAPVANVPHDLGSATREFKIGSDWGWLAQDGGGIQGIDLTDPDLPVPGPVLTPPSAVQVIAPFKGVLYAGTATGLRVYSLINPAQPVDLGETPLPRPVEDMSLHGNFLYVVDNAGTLHIFNAVNPYFPAEVAIETTWLSPPFNLVCSGDLAYVRDASSLWVWDISNPTDPVYLGNRNLNFKEFIVRDELAIGIMHDDVVAIWDYTDPLSPGLRSALEVGDTVLSFAVVGDIAYVSCASGTVRAFDISDVDAIEPHGDLAFAGENLIAHRFPNLYGVSDGLVTVQGLACASIAALDCNADGLEDSAQIAANPTRDWNGDGILDACQQGQGLSDVPTATAPPFTLHPAFPNPFNPHTTIAFTLARADRVHLTVFDTRGRRVRHLADGRTYPAGRAEIAWNGRDESGRTAPSGSYYYRLQVGGESGTGRLVLLK